MGMLVLMVKVVTMEEEDMVVIKLLILAQPALEHN